jgi:hypothetical protein
MLQTYAMVTHQNQIHRGYHLYIANFFLKRENVVLVERCLHSTWQRPWQCPLPSCRRQSLAANFCFSCKIEARLLSWPMDEPRKGLPRWLNGHVVYARWWRHGRRTSNFSVVASEASRLDRSRCMHHIRVIGCASICVTLLARSCQVSYNGLTCLP